MAGIQEIQELILVRRFTTGLRDFAGHGDDERLPESQSFRFRVRSGWSTESGQAVRGEHPSGPDENAAGFSEMRERI